MALLSHETKQRKSGRFWLVVIALGLAVLAQSYLATKQPLLDALIFYALASIIFVWARRGTSAVPSSPSVPPLPRPAWARKAFWACFLLALASSGLGLWGFTQENHSHSPWLFYLASLLLIVSATLVLETPRLPALSWPRLKEKLATLVSDSHWLWLALILLLAFLLRAYNLESLPFGLWYDEADNGLAARRILSEPNYRPVYVQSTNYPAFLIYLIAFSFRVFGEGVLGLRAVSLTLGLLTVVAFYVLVRQLWNREIALAGAFLLAVSRWDIIWSRLSLHGVSAPLFTVAAAALLLYALRSRSFLPFALAGLGLGLSLTSSELTPPFTFTSSLSLCPAPTASNGGDSFSLWKKEIIPWLSRLLAMPRFWLTVNLF